MLTHIQNQPWFSLAKMEVAAQPSQKQQEDTALQVAQLACFLPDIIKRFLAEEGKRLLDPPDKSRRVKLPYR